MESDSARVSRSRPFYSTHADAYDLLVTDPVDPWVDAVDQALTSRGHTRATILDAGCGTGRHAAALIRRGHHLTLADASPDLLTLAQRRCPTSPAWHVDLTIFTTSARFTAITCRGVLNDLLTDSDRQAALDAMAASLAPGGLLLLDVRDAQGSAARADGTPRRISVTVPPATASTGSGSAVLPSVHSDPGDHRLMFTTTSRWTDGLLQVHEEHLLRHGARTTRSEYAFTMRPWTAAELTDRLHRAGLADVDIRPGIGHRAPDRLFVIATRTQDAAHLH